MHADPYVALEIVIGISSLYWDAAAGSELSELKDKGGCCGSALSGRAKQTV